MANYSLVANSTFQPFTYQELAVPLDRQDAYHENLMQQYEQLSDKADILEAMGANDRDRGSKVYGQYKTYSDALRAEADNLYRHGLDTESRLRLTELRRRYNQEIVPIQNAWNKREQEAEMQMKAQMANPNLRFTRDARSSTLDDYIANPTGGYGVVNLNTITAQMAGMAKNLAKQIQSGAIKKENIDEFTYNIINKHGLDPNFINDWLQHPEKSPTLTNMMNQVLQSNGVTLESLRGSQNGESILRDATSAAQMGAWEAVGDDNAQLTPNWRARQDYEFNQQMTAMAVRDQMEMRKAAMKAAMEASANSTGNVPTVTSVGVGLVPSESYRAENMKVLDTLKGGNNGFKAKYFGSKLGQVNPMKLYEEVKAGSKKEDVLRKYSRFGVRDIISKDQYEALQSLGYKSSEVFKPKRYSDVLNDFDKQVEQRSRYSTNMADYDAFNEKAIPNLLSRREYGKEAGTVWEIKKDGKQGSPASIKDLNLRTQDNTKGNTITDVQYDPQFKGKIVIQLSNGKMFIADPGIYDSNMANTIANGERAGAPAIDITRALVRLLNERNKVKGKTDSKIE